MRRHPRALQVVRRNDRHLWQINLCQRRIPEHLSREDLLSNQSHLALKTSIQPALGPQCDAWASYRYLTLYPSYCLSSCSFPRGCVSLCDPGLFSQILTQEYWSFANLVFPEFSGVTWESTAWCLCVCGRLAFEIWSFYLACFCFT